ncbi:MAG TPA: SGNH/GDSL hydrolase family protein [Anaerovoracaceae bacterium]|nr:SGNH/GDSL hydrolase family protein [Anaerovoracaceae bacterium]
MKQLIITALLVATTCTAQAETTEVNRQILLGSADSCYVLGDSIALGISMSLPQCSANAKKGITSSQFLQRFPGAVQAHKVIISLGVNDGANAGTQRNLEALRKHINSSQVVWVLPNAKYAHQRAAVQAVAAEFHDQAKAVDQYASTDGIHPTLNGYRTISYQLANR